jgi:acetone carboxylase gamma subunit
LSDEENESVEEAAVERNNVKIDVLNKAKLDMIDRRVWISRFNQQRLENDSGKNMVSNLVVNEDAIKDDDNVAIPISDGMKVVEELQQKMISKKNMAVAEEKNKEWSELKNIAVELNKNKKSTDTMQRKKKEIKLLKS